MDVSYFKIETGFTDMLLLQLSGISEIGSLTLCVMLLSGYVTANDVVIRTVEKVL